MERPAVENYQNLLDRIFGKNTDHKVSPHKKELIARGNGESILVVEDSLPNQLVAKTLLENFNYKVDIASDGIEAIKQVENNIYALVLMDLSMPRMDGAQACKIIRSKGGRFTLLPIWAMTANIANSDIQHCKDAGMDDFVEKPINRKILLTKINTLMKTTNKNSPLVEITVAPTKEYIEPAVVNQLIKDTGSPVFTTILGLFIEEDKTTYYSNK